MSEVKKLRGFARLTEDRRREIASLGGKAAHECGTAHEWTPSEAREASLKSKKPRGKK